jgi:UDP-glucose 4-epimerase
MSAAVHGAEPLAGKRILITGGFGFLATALVARLAEVPLEIIRAARRAAPDKPWTHGKARVEPMQGDVRERSFWARALPRADVVFHFAAQTSVYVAEQNPEEDRLANVQSMAHLLEVCRQSGLRPAIVFAGSATQVGIPPRIPVDETFPDQPITVYDSHKLLAEGMLEKAARLGQVAGTTLRLANVYGPGPASGASDRGVLNHMARRALRGEKLTVYGDGSQVRDYLYVDDAAEAFLCAAVSLERTSGAHFVVGSGTGHTIAEAFSLVAERAACLVGRRVPVITVPPPPGLSPIEDRSFVADVRKFEAASGWVPRISLTEGIDRTLNALRGAV